MALKSRKKLHKALQFLKELGYQFNLPAKASELRNEIFGRQAFIFFDWPSEEMRRDCEKWLKKEGFKVCPEYWPGSGVSEIQVSYFKGWHWDE